MRKVRNFLLKYVGHFSLERCVKCS